MNARIARLSSPVAHAPLSKLLRLALLDRQIAEERERLAREARWGGGYGDELTTVPDGCSSCRAPGGSSRFTLTQG